MKPVTFPELRRTHLRSTITAMMLVLLSTAAGAQPQPKPAPEAPIPPEPPFVNIKVKELRDRVHDLNRRANDNYRRGARAIDNRQYESAIESFQYVVEAKDARADGALYWKGYAQSRLGRGADALATLSELEKQHPQSRWLNDAKALQVEIRQASGQAPRPEALEDEELKLLAINGLMHNDPESAVPLLEKVLHSSKNPPRLKQRALFVLAQSRDPRARQIVTQYAKGGSNPDLQVTAVEYLGVMGSKQPETRATLNEIYQATSDAAVRRAVLRGFMSARDKDSLFRVAQSESNADLRREAVQLLGVTGGHAELVQLYQSEKDKSLRRAILDGLYTSGKPALLIDVARKETDPELKREAVQRLSTMKSKEATAYLEELLGK